MNICMFTNTYTPHVGGVARSVKFFSEDLRKMGHQVLMFAPTFPEKSQDTSEAFSKDEPEEENVVRVPAIQNFNGSDFSVRIPAPYYIDEKLDQFRPDVIHSHHPYLLGDAALRAAWRRHLPLVFTHHTLYEKYTHYVSAESEAMEVFAINLTTEYANLCSQVVAPSRSIAELIAGRGVKRPIIEIPTGVDIGFFSEGDGQKFRSAHGISRNASVIGHLGRLAPEKNLDYLCEAAALYMRSSPETVFLVVGEGPSEDDILAIFKENKLEDRLILAGSASGDDLVNAYHAMDLFVFSSKSETQGMVLTEAMAAGKPVIALDAPGAREVVDDRTNGRLLPGDAAPELFADAIGEFFNHPSAPMQWCNGAKAKAETFSRTASAEKIMQIYDSLKNRQDGIAGGSAADDVAIPWDTLLNAVKAEWALISEKAKAVAKTIQTIEE